MLHLKIAELLKLKGYKSNVNMLVRLGLNFYTARDLFHGKKRTIHLDDLETLCEFLRCTPNDLIHFEAGKNQEFDEQHPLPTLAKKYYDTSFEYLKKLNLQQTMQLTKVIDQFVDDLKKEEKE